MVGNSRESTMICQKSNSSTIKGWDTLQEIVQIKEESKREYFMHLFLQKMNLKERKQGETPVIRRQRKNIITSHLSPVPLLTMMRLGWCIVVLPDI